MNKRTSNTIQTYNNLGIEYLKDIEPLVPIEREEFIKSFKPGDHILDLGCAGGRDSKFFVDQGIKVTGVDLSDVFLKEAKKRVPDATLILMDATKLDFQKETFDGVWANAVLLHLTKKDIPKVLEDIYSILKPKGLLHIRVKEGEGERLVKDYLSKDVARAFTFFSKEEIEEFLTSAGFKISNSQIITDEGGRKSVNWISVSASK